jgi:hypothetical protein
MANPPARAMKKEEKTVIVENRVHDRGSGRNIAHALLPAAAVVAVVATARKNEAEVVTESAETHPETKNDVRVLDLVVGAVGRENILVRDPVNDHGLIVATPVAIAIDGRRLDVDDLDRLVGGSDLV